MHATAEATQPVADADLSTRPCGKPASSGAASEGTSTPPAPRSRIFPDRGVFPSRAPTPDDRFAASVAVQLANMLDERTPRTCPRAAASFLAGYVTVNRYPTRDSGLSPEDVTKIAFAEARRAAGAPAHERRPTRRGYHPTHDWAPADEDDEEGEHECSFCDVVSSSPFAAETCPKTITPRELVSMMGNLHDADLPLRDSLREIFGEVKDAGETATPADLVAETLHDFRASAVLTHDEYDAVERLISLLARRRSNTDVQTTEDDGDGAIARGEDRQMTKILNLSTYRSDRSERGGTPCPA